MLLPVFVAFSRSACPSARGNTIFFSGLREWLLATVLVSRPITPSAPTG